MVRRLISFEIGNINDLDGGGLVKTLDDLMIHTGDLTKENAHDEAERAVPFLKGPLRKSIHQSIDTSEYDGTRFTLRFGSKLKYAKWVDRMGTNVPELYGVNRYGTPLMGKVRHGIDPEAEGHYSQYLAKEFKFRLKLNWDLSKKVINAP